MLCRYLICVFVCVSCVFYVWFTCFLCVVCVFFSLCGCVSTCACLCVCFCVFEGGWGEGKTPCRVCSVHTFANVFHPLSPPLNSVGQLSLRGHAEVVSCLIRYYDMYRLKVTRKNGGFGVCCPSYMYSCTPLAFSPFA